MRAIGQAAKRRVTRDASGQRIVVGARPDNVRGSGVNLRGSNPPGAPAKAPTRIEAALAKLADIEPVPDDPMMVLLLNLGLVRVRRAAPTSAPKPKHRRGGRPSPKVPTAEEVAKLDDRTARSRLFVSLEEADAELTGDLGSRRVQRAVALDEEKEDV